MAQVGSTGPTPAPVASSERSVPPIDSSQPSPPTVPSPPPLPDAGSVPEGRGAAQLAYDTTRHVAVLFSGNGSNGLTSGTWTWDGRQWSQVQVNVAPQPRLGGAFIYDSVRHVSLLFGGATDTGAGNALNDTWTFDGTRWSLLSPATAPSPRAFSVVAFDSHRGLVVLFGGYAAQSGLNDVWTWDGTNWTQVASASSPPNLFPLGLAYRQSDDSLLLAGQSAGGGGITSAVQSWSYVQQTWSQVTSSTAVPCVDHYGASAEDVQRGKLVFFGGYCTGATVQWDGSAWTQIAPTSSPVNRGNEAGRPAMTYYADHQVVLLFGGVGSGNYFNDLWSWDGAGWTKVA